METVWFLLVALMLVAYAALVFSLASCKSASGNSESANNAQPNASPAAAFTPPPGAEEISEDRFKKDAQQNPDDPTPHFNLGNIYLAEGKFDEAADELKLVVSKNPKDVDALAKLGIAYASANKYDDAIDAFKRAIALSPNSADLHRRLADAYDKSGRGADAERTNRTRAGSRPPPGSAARMDRIAGTALIHVMLRSLTNPGGCGPREAAALMPSFSRSRSASLRNWTGSWPLRGAPRVQTWSSLLRTVA